MPTATPLTDAINALTTYVNETTGASDTTLSDAVGTLVAGYGGAGGISIDDIAQNIEPSGAITLGSGVTTIGANAFRNKPITSISSDYVTTLGGGFITGSRCVTASFPNVTAVASNMFESCAYLENVYLPNATFENISSNYCFRYCQKLKNTDFSNAQKIGTACFLQGYELEKLDFPKVTYIYGQAFQDCRKLQTLILRSNSVVTLSNINAFQNTPMRGYNSLTGTIYVPSALISSYQTASNWSTLYSGGYCTFAAIEGSQYE